MIKRNIKRVLGTMKVKVRFFLCGLFTGHNYITLYSSGFPFQACTICKKCYEEVKKEANDKCYSHSS